MHENILANFILFLKIYHSVNAKDGPSNKNGTCERLNNLEYDCREMNLQAVQNFKWLTEEDTISCKNSSKGLTLNLVHIVFPTKALYEDWFKSPCHITALKISRSNLGRIEENAFRSDIFSKLTELRLRYADIWLIKMGAFNGLTELTLLTLNSLGLDAVAKNVLVSCPKLKEVQIYFSFDTAHPIQNKWFSGDELLNELETVDWFGNEIGKGIDNTTFNAAINLKFLSLRDNCIETIGDGAFKPIKNLKSLDLTFNLLKTIPSELKNLVDHRRDIYFELGANPWECTCDLKSVRQLYLERESFTYPIICKGGVRIEKCMDLCLEDSECHDVQETPENLLPFWQQLSLTDHVISVKCNASIVLNRPSTRIFIGQYMDSDYFINLSGFTSQQIVVVFEVGIYATAENSTCITNNRNVQTAYMPFSIRLRPNTSYLFCFSDKGTLSIRPLNCFAFHSKREEINTAENAWISNEDRHIIIFLCIVSGIISISLGIALAFIAPKIEALFLNNDHETHINQSCYIENRPSLRRKRRVTKLRSKPKYYHPKFHRMNSRSMPMLLPSEVSTPSTKSVNRCCNSENCQCYCEILMD